MPGINGTKGEKGERGLQGPKVNIFCRIFF